jgi:hypothetical protein
MKEMDDLIDSISMAYYIHYSLPSPHPPSSLTPSGVGGLGSYLRMNAGEPWLCSSDHTETQSTALRLARCFHSTAWCLLYVHAAAHTCVCGPRGSSSHRPSTGSTTR